MDVLFTPPVTRAEVSVVYPGAAIERLPDSMPRNATASEAAELRQLIGKVLADDTDRAEALAAAVGDPDAALMSFRELAADLT